jgi:hypothetical protein
VKVQSRQKRIASPAKRPKTRKGTMDEARKEKNPAAVVSEVSVIGRAISATACRRTGRCSGPARRARSCW